MPTKVILQLFVVMLFLFGTSRTTATQLCKPEKRTADYTGKVECYLSHKPDILRSRYVMKQGKKHGVSTLYYANGQIRAISHYQQGQHHYTEATYSDQGKIQTSYDPKKNMRTEYFESGRPEFQVYYEERMRHKRPRKEIVRRLSYYQNGRIKQEQKEADPEKAIIQEQNYYDSGRLASSGFKFNGYNFDWWRYYHENGALSLEKHYHLRENYVTEAKFYDKTGVLEKHEHYYPDGSRK